MKLLPLSINSQTTFNSAFVPLLTNAPETRKRLHIHEGGRGSGKSDAIAQYVILAAYGSRKRILLGRKVERTIRNSQWRLIRDYVAKWNLDPFFVFTVSPLGIKVANGSEFICSGFDEPTRIKSMANIDIAWIEEADELTEEDFDTLNFTLRGKPNQRIILTFNRRIGNWTEKIFFDKNQQYVEREDAYHTHTTFRDNQFLLLSDIQRFERLKAEDPKKFEKVALGLPVALEGVVYNNWDIVDEFPQKCEETIYGLDFGFTDPKALVKCGRIGNEIYLEEKVYSSHLIREDFIRLLPLVIDNRADEIWADSEDPESIQVIANAGWNIHAVEKHKGSVVFGVEAVKAFRLHIVRGSDNVIKDFENYSWSAKKEEPEHSYSHAPRAVEYAVRSRWAGIHSEITERDVKDTEFQVLESVTNLANY